ncbi:TIGR02757 family protein [uncultured Bacteroides sp.]|uniref:TIGR02757 family protein n=1 Tax=uncultured Bacteroides sp. TaxID=162156 RepID=UPI00261BDF8C|nr:TIGR02757 family protein [uncultured Bacteroides sp.]
MKKTLKEQLQRWAEEYHKAAFIKNDPVQFPHRYSRKEDIEICGLLTALLSFGNRKQILKKVDELDGIMQHEPLQYVLSRQWQEDFKSDDMCSFYRMVSYATFRTYFERLYIVYADGKTLEDALLQYKGIPMQKLCAFWEVSDRSPQKKLNMFLRWMVRRNSEVDFGLWLRMDPSQLIIPLDTHVCRMACQLGLIEKETFSLTTAKKITEAMEKVFPGDPCLGDFALFGYGVNHV